MIGKGEPSARGDNRLVVAMPYDARLFNEIYRNYTGGGGYFAANNLFNRLVVLDVFGDGQVVPDLAERWEVLESGATYRFHLRRDVRWHDGAPFTAEDVRHSYATALEHRYHGAAWLSDIRDIAVLDPHTVELRLAQPNGGFLAQLGIFVFTHILPAHLYAGTDWATNPHNISPVGTGPFRFVEWRRGESVLLEANPHYFRGRPALDQLEYRVIPDLDEALARLERGEVDFCVEYAPCERVPYLAALPGVGVETSSGNALTHLAFNFRRQPWADPRAREAIARAIDRESLAAGVCPGAEPTRNSYLRKVGWAFNPDALLPAHDPGGAEALLETAGIPRDADGLRLRPRLVCRDLFKAHGRTAELLAHQLLPLGIVPRVDRLDPVLWREQVQEAGDFDLAVDSGDIGPDPVSLEALLSSDGQRNYTGYSNPQVDDLLRRGKAAADRESRGALYREAQAVLSRDVARLYLFQHDAHLAYRKEWEGWSWEPPVRGTLPYWCHERIRPATRSSGRELL